MTLCSIIYGNGRVANRAKEDKPLSDRLPSLSQGAFSITYLSPFLNLAWTILLLPKALLFTKVCFLHWGKQCIGELLLGKMSFGALEQRPSDISKTI